MPDGPVGRSSRVLVSVLLVALAAPLLGVSASSPAWGATMDPIGCPDEIEEAWYDNGDFVGGDDPLDFPFEPDDFDPQASAQSLDLRLLEYIACVFSYAVHASVADGNDPDAVISHLDSVLEGDSPGMVLGDGWWELCPESFPSQVRLATSTVDDESFVHDDPVWFGLAIRCGYAPGDACPEVLSSLDTSASIDLLAEFSFDEIIDYVACTFEWEFHVAAAATGPGSYGAVFDDAFEQLADCYDTDATCLDDGWEPHLCPDDPAQVPAELATNVAFLGAWWPNHITDPRNWQDDLGLQGVQDACAAYDPPSDGPTGGNGSGDSGDDEPDEDVEVLDAEEVVDEDDATIGESEPVAPSDDVSSAPTGGDARTQAAPDEPAEDVAVDSSGREIGEGTSPVLAHAPPPVSDVRGTIVRTLRTPAASWADPRETSISVLLAVGLVLLMMLPSQLFNTALAANSARIRRALPAPSAWLRRLGSVVDRHSYGLPGLFAYASVAAIVLSFLDPSVGLNVRTATTIAGVTLALALLLGIKSTAELWFARRRRGLGGDVWFRALPWALPITLLCVVLSRSLGFQPGYLYGLIAGVWFGTSVHVLDRGRVAMAGGITVLVTSLVAWFAWWSILPAASSPGASVGLAVSEVALASVFIAGIQGALIGWLPIRWFDGSLLHTYSRVAWSFMYGAAALLVIHILLRPETGYAAWTEDVSTLFVLSMFVIFGLASTCFYVWFRLRPDPTGASDAPVLTHTSSRAATTDATDPTDETDATKGSRSP